MSELADKVSETVKQQWEQVNDSAVQLTKAGRGLAMKLSSEVEKQFGHLVKTGEAQKEEGRTIIEQVKNSFDGQFEDVKGSVDQVKLASLGLLTKVRESGEKVFKELVELGEAHKSQAAAGAESKEAAV